jgi:hypothetical protein
LGIWIAISRIHLVKIQDEFYTAWRDDGFSKKVSTNYSVILFSDYAYEWVIIHTDWRVFPGSTFPKNASLSHRSHNHKTYVKSRVWAHSLFRNSKLLKKSS